MKILVRIMGITIIGLLTIICIIYLINTNVIINELNNCSALAMKQTQELMKKKIVDQLDKKQSYIFSDISYEDYYKKCFNEAVVDSNVYNLYVEGDADKGIIYVKIRVPRYKFIPEKRLLHIIDVKGEGLDNIDSLYYEEQTRIVKTKIAMTSQNFNPQILKSWNAESDKPRVFTGFNLIIYASNGLSTDPRSIIGPLVEVRCIDMNDEVNILAREEGGEFNQTRLSSNERCSCKLLEIVLPEGINLNEYSIRTDTINIYRTSYISEEVTTLVEKQDYLLSEHVNVDMRYIDDKNKLSNDSIWLQDVLYTNTLNYFISKLYEIFN